MSIYEKHLINKKVRLVDKFRRDRENKMREICLDAIRCDESIGEDYRIALDSLINYMAITNEALTVTDVDKMHADLNRKKTFTIRETDGLYPFIKKNIRQLTMYFRIDGINLEYVNNTYEFTWY